MTSLAAQTSPKALLPRLTTTVPREYVHRAAVSEVFLTGWEADESTEADRYAYTVKAQWPRSHALFAREDGHQDPVLLVESVRQIGSLLAHAEFDVPFGHQFVMADITVDADPRLFATDVVPTEVELRTVCRDTVRRGRTLSAMRYDVSVLRDGRRLATAGASFRCLSPSVYRRVRGERPTAPDRTVPPAIDPAAVGHASARHVVLARPEPGAGHRWEMRVDTAHPTYFDHPVDHVPGMVLIEAARQAAHASTGLPDALLLGVRADFARYAEFDAPCWIEAAPEPVDGTDDVRVRVRGSQREATVFTADLVVSPGKHLAVSPGKR
ncbi:ScbA/BarX family gamma-butyrolactone biosynthesis protein [Streptomyces similanensis]|uniref:ScbA/BarX family gamma-butyrolactone biosynthesis protein n=1 Tax=Streptomyces similanensis TaxID=1274988 RepID=A0ABP9LBP0_9ACTN